MLLPEIPSDLYHFETLGRNSGYTHIVGVDEAGRGPLAGPVVAAAVKLAKGIFISGIADSKTLSPAKRTAIRQRILGHPGIEVGIAVVSSSEIDRLNIREATHRAMRNAVLQIQSGVDLIFVDGLPVSGFHYPSRNIIKGDGKVACIAAASIVAKVHRDNLMIELEKTYPGYGFSRHKGYGTKEHIQALNRLGPCPIHRRSFAPVAAAMSSTPLGSVKK